MEDFRSLEYTKHISSTQFFHPSFCSSGLNIPGLQTSLCGRGPVVLAGHLYGDEDTRGRRGVASVPAPSLQVYVVM